MDVGGWPQGGCDLAEKCKREH